MQVHHACHAPVTARRVAGFRAGTREQGGGLPVARIGVGDGPDDRRGETPVPDVQGRLAREFRQQRVARQLGEQSLEIRQRVGIAAFLEGLLRVVELLLLLRIQLGGEVLG